MMPALFFFAMQQFLLSALEILLFPQKQQVPKFPTTPIIHSYLDYNKQAVLSEYLGFLETSLDSYPEGLQKQILADCSASKEIQKKLNPIIWQQRAEVEFGPEFFCGNTSRMKYFNGHLLIFKENIWFSRFKEDPDENQTSLKLIKGAHIDSIFKLLPQRLPDKSGKSQKHRMLADLDEAMDKLSFYSLGYVGSYRNDLACIFYLNSDRVASKNLQPFINHKRQKVPYANREICSESPSNKQQRKIVGRLQNDIEFIQGPPGTGNFDSSKKFSFTHHDCPCMRCSFTGKTTTIFHILNSKLPDTGIALVASVQNKAVESVAEKLAKTFHRIPFIVLGNPESESFLEASTALKYTIDMQVERDPAVLLAKKTLATNKTQAFVVTIGNSTRTQRVNSTALDNLRLIKLLSRQAIIARARIIVCTVDTAISLAINARCCRMGDKTDTFWPAVSNIVMAVIDEASTVAEYKLPGLAMFDFSSFIAVGDHRQLPPFTTLKQRRGLAGFFERLIQHGFPVSMLTEQYRMHPLICRFVSEAFYSRKLVTNERTSKARNTTTGPLGIIWLDYPDNKAETEVGTSKENKREVQMVLSLLSQEWVAELLLQGKTILVISFYAAQTQILRREIFRLFVTLPQDVASRIRVGTVDAAQGSEADVVILSSVRCNEKMVAGFVSDRQRLCVATSRARQCLYVVGSSKTLIQQKGWHALYKLAEVQPGSLRPGLDKDCDAARQGSMKDLQDRMELLALSNSDVEVKRQGPNCKGTRTGHNPLSRGTPTGTKQVDPLGSRAGMGSMAGNSSSPGRPKIMIVAKKNQPLAPLQTK